MTLRKYLQKKLNKDMNEEKTYYEKILVTTGEAPEVTGYYHFFRKNDKNKVEFLKFIAKSQSDKEWFRKHMSAWLKPVPSPKQEAVGFAEWFWENATRYKDKYLLKSVDDDYLEFTLSELYDKFKEKGESK